MRRGVEARRTRSVARIGRLEKLRATRLARRNAVGQVRASVDAGLPSGKIVGELSDVSMVFGDKAVVNNFSATLLRGDKIGLVGPNGAGKTTLLKLILGELEPTTGKVRQGANLPHAWGGPSAGSHHLMQGVAALQPSGAALATSTRSIRTRSSLTPPASSSSRLSTSRRRSASGWKVYDLNVLGAWLIQTYQQQFNEKIQQSGVDGLIQFLTQRNQQLAAGKQAS